jgi:hypothetical protein
MSPTAEKLRQQVLSLDERARASVAGALIESLHEPDGPGVEEAWDIENRRRVEELESSAVQRIPGKKSGSACFLASSELIWHPAAIVDHWPAHRSSGTRPSFLGIPWQKVL